MIVKRSANNDDLLNGGRSFKQKGYGVSEELVIVRLTRGTSGTDDETFEIGAVGQNDRSNVKSWKEITQAIYVVTIKMGDAQEVEVAIENQIAIPAYNRSQRGGSGHGAAIENPMERNGRIYIGYSATGKDALTSRMEAIFELEHGGHGLLK